MAKIQTIPWIGYNNQHGPSYKLKLEEKGFVIPPLYSASSGLDYVMQKHPQLIIVNDYFESWGELKVLEDVNPERPAELTAYFIQRVRQTEKDARIVVPHIGLNQDELEVICCGNKTNINFVNFMDVLPTQFSKLISELANYSQRL